MIDRRKRHRGWQAARGSETMPGFVLLVDPQNLISITLFHNGDQDKETHTHTHTHTEPHTYAHAHATAQ